MKPDDWRSELQELATRHPETGVYLDLPAMDETERFMCLAWLRRYAEGGE